MATAQEVIKRFIYRYMVEGAEKVVAANKAVAASSEQQARASLSLDKQFGNLERRFVTQVRAQQDYEKVQRQVNAAVAQNPALQERATVVLAAARQRYDEATAAVDRHNGAFTRLANTLTRRFIFAFLASQVREAVQAVFALNAELAKTGDIAARARIDSGTFQGFQGAAASRGIAGGAFGDQMLEFTRNVERAQQGLGSLGILFRANNVTVKDTADAFLQVADLVARARNEAEKESIIRQTGLPVTREWVRFLEQGSTAIKQAGAETSKLSNEQFKQAQKIEDQWNAMWARMSSFAKAQVLQIFDPKTWFNLQITPGSFAEKLFFPGGRPGSGGTSGLTVNQNDQALRDIPSLTVNKPVFDIAKERELLQLQQQRISALGNLVSIEEIVAAKQREINILNAEGAKITETQTKAIIARTRIEAEAQRLSYNLAFERAQLGRTTTEQRVASDLRGAGISADSAQGQLLADQIRLNEALKTGKDLATEFATGFARDLRSGVGAMQALTNALTRFTDKLLDMALQNLVAKAFGALLPGTGGPTTVFGAAGSLGVPTFHSGGIAGVTATPMRYVHPAYFDDAPRFASGLNRTGFDINEVPAVLHKGEVVGWPNQMRQAFGGGVAVNVAVNADNGMSNAEIGRLVGTTVEKRLDQFRRKELSGHIAEQRSDPRAR